MKSGKQIKIEDILNYNVTYGCVDNKNPKSVYVNITAWLEPSSEEDENYNKIIKNLNKKIRQTIYNFFVSNKTIFIKEKTIVDLDLRESGIKFGKRSFMSCEVTLFQENDLSINSDLMKKDLSTLSNLITNEIFDSNHDFKFYKKKR